MTARTQMKILGLILAGVLIASPVGAQEDYPSKPVRVIVPFPAGRATDVNTRQFLAKISPLLGQPLVVGHSSASAVIRPFFANAAPNCMHR